MARLIEKYKQQVVPQLIEKFKYKNTISVPRIQKIVVNMGIGRATENKKLIEEATKHLTVITGQKPLVTKAKKAISGFKLRKDQAIGCKVTLRGRRMYEFLDRLISIVLPRIRDFRGLSPKSFDGRGNYTIGLTEQIVFPEITIESVEFVQGMDITIVVTGNSNEQSCMLLKLLGMPFRLE
ncbi:MAG: 50S ribosomal protein L5 [Candidatus Brocadia sp.]|jgi:large subunit ribosomal protein L5|nr:50S ribosomal protein L5 [Candidatus Brocadia fulgida]MCC6325648.1 50S ribosomal protein L5 [Candidatus Brocadia sp.]MCE7912031.1 50S ribosomal protein L5 [Candidatus Brocadia sp. AMX3]OQY98446.1 MAG: 50S ribosomal protein L5 [Candidatus Brocadia sp. UTAMX2]MDG5997103.1 50S ribosomal protein L5 [Candidatus Brocadia sp.]